MSSSVQVWEKKYDQALVNLESRLTKVGKLNEALLVKNELIYFRRNVNSRIKKSDEENADQNGILGLCSRLQRGESEGSRRSRVFD